MTCRIIKLFFFLLFTGSLLVSGANVAMSESLFESYSRSDRSNLEAETRDMGRQLKSVFNPVSIAARQQQIDFAKYFSNLRKLVVYSNKLATYSEYEKDLKFARDNDIFKGLPDAPSASENREESADRKMFVRDKYDRMKKNVEEEIDTYEDLVLLSLDVCENMAEYDLTHLLENPSNRNQVIRFKEGEEFIQYETKRNRLASHWPVLESRINHQFALWDAEPSGPDTPLIDPAIIGAL